MIYSTTEIIPGREISESVGVVTGNVVQAKHIGRDIMAGLKSIVGGELQSYSILLMQARQEAMERMIANAKEMEADAVVNFRYETSTIAAAASEVIAYGTAIRFKN